MFSDNTLNGSWYFVGIGGVSMSALAELLSDRGLCVRGSDASESVFTRQLRGRGIPVSIGDSETVTQDNVVFTGAIGKDHRQFKAAKEAGKRLYSRAELLGKVAREFSHVISVAGCHGKTSTTSMLSHIFHVNGRSFTCHIGGEDLALGNYKSTGTDCFITEACEFQRSFLSLNSEIAVILNTDLDHTDCYRSEEELLSAYREFAARAKRTVVNADDLRTQTIPHDLSFGLYSGDIRAEKIRSEGEKYSFTVSEGGVPVVRIRLGTVGKVCMVNALAAYAAARLFGFTAEEIKRGLENFRGVKRRYETVGTFCGAPMICDYAHHPREISAVFSTAQNQCEGTVRLVFQPHTYTRTRDLMRDFARVLKEAENPIIYRTFAARETFEYEGSAVALVSRIPESVYVQSPEQLRARLAQETRPEDIILVLGAGDIYEIARDLAEKTPPS